MLTYIFLCNKCGRYGTGQTRNVSNYNYRCFFCYRKEKVYSKRTGTMLHYKGPYAPREAMLLCVEMNAET